MIVTYVSVSIKAPNILSAQKIDSMSFNVSWDPVPDGSESAVVLGYRISYYSVNDHNSLHIVTYTRINNSEYSVMLNSLQLYSNYCVQVLAFTISGEGPVSGCFFLTVAGGKMLLTSLFISVQFEFPMHIT